MVQQSMDKKEVTYEIINSNGKFVAVVLPYREGRLPIARTQINSAFCVELTCADGKIEVLGHPGMPCPVSLIELLRSSKEEDGMLLVELFEMDDPRATAFETGAPPVAGEQKLRAPFVKPA